MPDKKNHLQQYLQDDYVPDPYNQFDKWYKEAQQNGSFDPAPMVVATVDEKGFPDTRIVLLKEYSPEGLIFYTHYNSPKAKQAERLGMVAVNIFWPVLARQIRLKGHIKRVPTSISDKYFASRPRESQINTLASQQSTVLKSKTEFLEKITKITENYAGKTIPRPETWGGYLISPYEYEFFEAGNYRLNNRIRYTKRNGNWSIDQLSP